MPRDSSDLSPWRRIDKKPGVNQAIAAVDGADPTPPCALALREDPAATLDDLREAVTTLEDVARIARRTFGGAHPDVAGIEQSLQDTRAALRARETPSPGGSA